MRKILMAACVVFLSLALVLPAMAADKKMVVGSKAFTEQRLLGQIMIQLLEKNGFKAEDKTGLGGTLVVREALVNIQDDLGSFAADIAGGIFGVGKSKAIKVEVK